MENFDSKVGASEEQYKDRVMGIEKDILELKRTQAEIIRRQAELQHRQLGIQIEMFRYKHGNNSDSYKNQNNYNLLERMQLYIDNLMLVTQKNNKELLKRLDKIIESNKI